MLPIAEVLLLNQYALGLHPMVDAVAWFAEFDASHKVDVLRELAAMIHQAHPQHEEVRAAIQRSGIKPTHTPAVLLSKSRPVHAGRLVLLPESEHERSFRLMVALLGVADGQRRNTECRNGCSHWWHRDLSDPALVPD